MTLWRNRTNPLIQRMAEDMLLRNLAQKTIDSYTYHIGRFAKFLVKPIEDATPEDLRSFQLHLVQQRNVSWSSFNQAVCELRFLYRITLPRAWPVTMIVTASATSANPRPRCARPESSRHRRSHTSLFHTSLRYAPRGQQQVSPGQSGTAVAVKRRPGLTIT